MSSVYKEGLRAALDALILYKKTRKEIYLNKAIKILRLLNKLKQKKTVKGSLSFPYAELDIFVNEKQKEAKKKGFEFVFLNYEKVKNKYRVLKTENETVRNDEYSAFRTTVSFSFKSDLINRKITYTFTKIKYDNTIDNEQVRANAVHFWKKQRKLSKKQKK